MENTVIVAFHHKKRNTWLDMEIPLDISANELIYGLNKGLNLGIDMSNVSECYMCTEDPRTLLRGDRLLESFGLRNGTIIHFDR